MTTTIRIEGEQPYVEQVLAKIKNLLLNEGEKVKIVVESESSNGSDDFIESWHRYKEEEDKILASLPWEEALKRIYGKE